MHSGSRERHRTPRMGFDDSAESEAFAASTSEGTQATSVNPRGRVSRPQQRIWKRSGKYEEEIIDITDEPTNDSPPAQASSQSPTRGKAMEEELESNSASTRFSDELDQSRTVTDSEQNINRSSRQEAWEEWFRILVEFRAENGHPNPKRDVVYQQKRLGEWANEQRKMMKKHTDGGSTGFVEERIARLNSIGFAWEGGNYQRQTAPATPETNDWEGWFVALKQFKAAMGHTTPSIESKLGIWVREQRSVLQNGRENDSDLSKARIAKLNSIDFTWTSESNEVSNHHKSWDDWLKLLIEFKRENGHVSPPHSTIYRGKKLGVWTTTQRVMMKRRNTGKGKDNSSFARTADSRISRLTAIGFDWKSAGDSVGIVSGGVETETINPTTMVAVEIDDLWPLIHHSTLHLLPPGKPRPGKIWNASKGIWLNISTSATSHTVAESNKSPSTTSPATTGMNVDRDSTDRDLTQKRALRDVVLGFPSQNKRARNDQTHQQQSQLEASLGLHKQPAGRPPKGMAWGSYKGEWAKAKPKTHPTGTGSKNGTVPQNPKCLQQNDGGYLSPDAKWNARTQMWNDKPPERLEWDPYNKQWVEEKAEPPRKQKLKQPRTPIIKKTPFSQQKLNPRVLKSTPAPNRQGVKTGQAKDEVETIVEETLDL
mmetsp:Transcript_20135/g.46871  ORF Transcript_20135/g.46871 Transcript_20135/m.46871 type:complete len:654 (-) Transcript_20135:76-2037(-)